FDCILLEYPAYGLAEASYKASKVYGIPLLMYYHMDNVADGVKGTVFRIYKKLFLPKILRHSSEILVSSIEYAESSNLAPYMKEISGKISVAPLGVDTHRFYQAGKKPELLRRHNIKQTETIIGFVGGLDTAHYFKGVPVLLQAIKKLKNYHPNVPFRCIIAGAGDLRDPYIKRSQELGVIDNVLFPGRISEGELAQYYQLFDLFVLPSIDSSEAFGLVILEAMATATPVVVSNLPGPASLVQNEETGFVVPPSDVDRLATALFKLLKDPYLRAEMGNKAHSVIKEKYQWQNVGKKLHECVSKYSK
ncbi:MAG: glycosyltransferase family 4 protein, partial [Candidatus Jacksonbacteria bacterium]|nr:glycosyltransferase family 4 protein [Candidatus Jacksonbacteria bacterium]